MKNAVLNILTENSCLFVVIPYIFSLCRSLSAVALAKADALVAIFSPHNQIRAKPALVKTGVEVYPPQAGGAEVSP